MNLHDLQYTLIPDLNYLIQIFKNHKLINIFQTEAFQNNRAKKYIDELKEKSKKIGIVYIRATPIMETLTGIMIAILIFYTGKLILKNEIDINSFFSFLAAMMLAYQPVRTLATLNIGINQGIAAANRSGRLAAIDQVPYPPMLKPVIYTRSRSMG